MVLTLEYIESNFHKFNKKYFQNKLETPKFEIMHTKFLLGQCCWSNRYDYCSGKNKRYNYRIRISNYFDCTEKDYCNTIIHEMIHLYIRQNDLEDDRRHHGHVFYSIADRINRDGWNIRRTDDRSGLEINTTKKITYHLAAFIDTTGKYFLMRYNPKNKSEFVRKFARYGYTGIIWFTSTDNKKYATFRECRKSVRGWFITKGEYKEIEEMYKERLAV